MVKPLMKWLGKYGDEVGEAAVKSVQNADSSLLSGLKNWWSAPHKLKPKYVKDALDVDVLSLSDDAIKATLSKRGPMTKEVMTQVNRATNHLAKAQQEARIAAEKAQKQVMKAQDTLRKAQSKEVDAVTMQSLWERLQQSEKYAQAMTDRAAKITDFQNGTRIQGPSAGLKELQSNPALREFIPPEWEQLIEPALRSRGQIFAAQSKNLNSPRKFLKEYKEILRREPNDEFRLAWETNEQNQRMLSSLSKRKQKIETQMLGKDKGGAGKAKEVKRPSLIGKGVDLAKKLGIGAAALAGGAGAIALYSWFDKNDPIQSAGGASGLAGDLRRIKTTNPQAAETVNSAIGALDKLNTMAGAANMGMASDPQRFASEFISTSSGELMTISAALSNWAAVQYGSQDPEHAQKAGEKLAKFAEKATKELQGLGKQLGVGIKDMGISGVQPANINANIKQVQSFLKQHVDSSIEASGQLDNKTTNILRNIEDYFNRRAETGDWTGTLVRENGQIVPYNKLVEAFDRIKKY